MPQDLFAWEHEPVANRRKKFIDHGGIGNDLNGFKGNREKKQYRCCNCKKKFEWDNTLEYSDYGTTVDNICGPCRKIQRTMMTNHPEMK